MPKLLMDTTVMTLSFGGITIVEQYNSAGIVGDGKMDMNIENSPNQHDTDRGILFGTYRPSLLPHNNPGSFASPNPGIGAVGDKYVLATWQGIVINNYNSANNNLVGSVSCELMDAAGTNPKPARYGMPVKYTGPVPQASSAGLAGMIMYHDAERLQKIEVADPADPKDQLMLSPILEVNETNYSSGVLRFGFSGGVPRNQTLALFIGQNNNLANVQTEFSVTWSGHGFLDIICPFTIV